MQKALVALLLLSLPFHPQGVRAEGPGPLRPDQVPEPLRPWTAWALRGHEAASCPWLLGQQSDGDESEVKRCSWPGRLDLQLDEKGGRFAFSARVYTAGPLALPGGEASWPEELREGGRPLPLVEGGDGPAVWLEPGDHTLTGRFVWRQLPESLPVPPDVGLLSLQLRGKAVPFPNREPGGLLWLQRQEADEEEAESRLDLQVSRRLSDGVPLLLLTRLTLEVSGKSREVLLGRALLPGFVPLALDSRIPARLEPDGRLRVQLRPGTQQIDLVARSEGPVASLALPQDPQGPWAAEEVWAWEAAPSLRAVELEGGTSVDATQTTLPAEWRALPTYRLRPGETLRFNERWRGDQDPAPDQLTLERTIWLDFDGAGATLQDRLGGTLTRAFRLDLPLPLQPGRVAVQGRDQLITRAREGAPAGVELRTGKVDLVAESRLEREPSRMPAAGWSDFHSVRATLHLPPGFRLFHATGVDRVDSTWLSRWSLLNLFLVLITALACGRLFGRGFGLLALVALGLSLPEEAPALAWLWPLAAEALLRVVPEGRLQRVISLLRVALLIALTLLLLPFALTHLRGGLYPALEFARGGLELPLPGAAPQDLAEAPRESKAFASPASPPPAPEPEDKEEARGDEGGSVTRLRRDVIQASGGLSQVAKKAHPKAQQLDLSQLDPKAVVQSGPGLPSWRWRPVRLEWNGPVERDAEVHLWLVPVWANRLLAFLRVGLLALLLLRLLLPRDRSLTSVGSLLPKGAGAAALLLLLAAPVRAAAPSEFPSAELLGQLREALLAKPACAPACVSSERLIVEATSTLLRMRQQVSLAAPGGVPLPGSASHWLPERLLVDGQPARQLARDDQGTLWLWFPAGVHQLRLEGPLPPRDALPLPLPLRPRHAEARLDGWTLDGLHEDGTVEETLQLGRARRSSDAARIDPGQLPPFLEVERVLQLGITWEVQTTVTRRSPGGVPVVVEVPLLAGESVTSAEVRAEKGKALVSLGRADQVSWRSTLAVARELTLEAQKGVAFTEVWRLDAAPLWHVEASGLPAEHQEPAEQRVPVWKPWPGEKLHLAIDRPEAVKGNSLTLLDARLTARPGSRSSEVGLSLELRSSRGQQHAVTLPAGAVLQSVRMDGATLPPGQEAGKVTLSLSPGTHRVALSWREPYGIGSLYRLPRPELGAPVVNAGLEVDLTDRWVLLAGGPRLGPAVLIWSFVLVMALASLALARLGLAPLRAHQWLLLSLGLSQLGAVPAALVAGALLALGLRRERGAQLTPGRFDLVQVLLGVWMVVAAALLFFAVEQGLLSAPEMQVAGNGSSGAVLRWFADRSEARLPVAWVLSAPLLVYRLFMLAWALWLASSLTRWLPWAWGCFSAGALWKPRPRGVKAATASAATPAGAGSGAAPAAAE